MEKPILIVGIDNSQSLRSTKTDSTDIIAIKNEIYTLYNTKYDIQLFTFGEKVTPISEPNFSEKTSNYSEFIDEIDKRYYNLNVGAIVLIGDGIYNEGENPAQLIGQIPAPLYSIGIGDTLPSIDQAIINVSHNQNVFLGNSFPVEIEATFSNYAQPVAHLQIYFENKLAWSEEIAIPQSDYYFSKTVNLKAEKPGLQNVSIQLLPFGNEQNTSNNYNRFAIEVHENKYNVLFLTQGPHPDIGALSVTLDKQANFNLTVANPESTIPNLENYNLIVLNQLPSNSIQQSDLLKKIMSGGSSLMLLLGPNSSISAFNNLNLSFSIKPTTTTQESFPFFNENYSVFSLPLTLQNVSAAYPPLITFFSEYNLGSEYAVLAYQKINGIEMSYPLLATGVINNRKVGIVCGEGIWRWRLTEFQNFENQVVFEQLFVNLFNYLCLKEVRDQFKIVYNRISPETSPVRIKAQVFNELFEPIPDAEVRLNLTDSTNAELTYLFDVNKADYNLNLGYLAPGKYNFTAYTNIGKNEFTKEGNFVVEEINLEQQNNKADFKLLYSLSEKTGGAFFTKENWKNVINSLNQDQTIKPKFHAEKNIYELIDLKLLFIAILLFLSLEWFLRKYWGSY
jgi:hypothetical protein